jgi:hypothetical protein
MEKQTVMQELLEFCEYRQTKAADGCKAAWNMILAKIKDDSLIEKEKEQIMDAHRRVSVGLYTDAEKYYNENFKK